MLTRTVEEKITFSNPFKVPGQRQLVPAGVYRINIMQELLQGLSFIAYRRTAVALYIPDESSSSPSKERSIIYEPRDFEAMILKDKLDRSHLLNKIKSSIAENIEFEPNAEHGLLSEIERGKNKGLFMPHKH